MSRGLPPKLRREKRHVNHQLTPHPGLHKGYELLGPARSRAGVGRSPAKLAGLLQPGNYDSQKSLGVARLRFSADRNVSGVAGESKGAAVSFPLARVSSCIALSDPSHWRERERPRLRERQCGSPRLPARGTDHRTVLRAAEKFSLNYFKVRYVRSI